MDSLSIKNNSNLKKVHRRTKSSYDSTISNNLSKTDPDPPEQNIISSLQNHQIFLNQSKEFIPDAIQTVKILNEVRKKDENKEIMVEKLELTDQELILQAKKPNLDMFEFGRKKINLFSRGLETSKSSNFEERVSFMKHKYEITEQSEHFFTIPEQNNEIDENLIKKELKETFNMNVLHNKVKSMMHANKESVEMEESLKNLIYNNQENKKNNLLQDDNSNKHRKNFSLMINKGILIKNSDNNNKKNLESIEKRVLILENEIFNLKNENIKLRTKNREFSQKIDLLIKEKKQEQSKLDQRLSHLESIIEKNNESLEKTESFLKNNEETLTLHSKFELKIEKKDFKNTLEKKKIDKEKQPITRPDSSSSKKKPNLEINVNAKPIAQPKKLIMNSKYTKSMSHFFEKVPNSDSEPINADYNTKINAPKTPNLASKGKKLFLTPKGATGKVIDKTFGNK